MTNAQQSWLANTEQVRWVAQYGISSAPLPATITLRDWPEEIKQNLFSKDDLGPSQNLFLAALVLAGAFAEKIEGAQGQRNEHFLFVLSHTLFNENSQIDLEKKGLTKFNGAHNPKLDKSWPGPTAAFFDMWKEASQEGAPMDAWMNELFWSVNMDITLISKKEGAEKHSNLPLGILINETSKAAYVIQAHEKAQKDDRDSVDGDEEPVLN
ncbi:hypothetical protein F9B85_00735 [Heliorestis acidaminivorans]|uniref:Uncharacterized protein n=1 Tax=Heliorestis acidaminivorans TaxID=553427 RepID=A0A6I0EV55_9FIRM|nr:hypothetical protein [Heliorestis acidaminivorans]KAB2954254.1 hypothetical protein F9B85_00735 [Heliorestis acidaminivorans]